MKNLKYAVIGILCLGCICMIPAAASEMTGGGNFDFKSWGQVLKEDSQKCDTYSLDADNIYARGNDAVVSNSDIEKGTRFYIASGMEEEAARQEAIEYFKVFEAMYAESVRQGYHVTEQEIETYLDEMKKGIFGSTTDEETQKQYREMIAQFDTEEDYWNYEKEVYRKQLPIEKLVNALEEKYQKENPNAVETDWDTYFENYKTELAEKENYKIVTQIQ